MRLLRFMSANEAIRLLQGKTLKNSTNHRATGQNSDSIGFCFSISSSDSEIADLVEIHTAAQRLSGITTMDVCLIGEVADSLLKRSTLTWGHYKTGDTSELCVGKYSLKDFQDWAMYTPQLPPPLTMLRVIASPHWVKPIRTITKQEHR